MPVLGLSHPCVGLTVALPLGFSVCPVCPSTQDKWTAATQDGRRSAQFEHTLLITETGVEALTGKLETSPKFFWEEQQ